MNFLGNERGPQIYVRSRDREHRLPLHDLQVATERPCSYPSEFFANNPGKKPPFAHPNYKCDRGRLHSTIRETFVTGRLSVELATHFLFSEFNLVPGTLVSDWISFGRVIGRTGERVNLSNILQVTEVEPPVEQLSPNSEIFSNRDLLRYLLAVCCVYRLIGVDREDYRADLIGAMHALIGQQEGSDLTLTSVYANFKNWSSFIGFGIVISAIDMFLQEFPTHLYATTRMGTITARFRDCSVLIALTEIAKMLGMHVSQLAPWMWALQVAKQTYAVCRGGQEFDNSRSYSMYFREMNLSAKSPYSAQANPDLHMFLHTVGTTAGHERSIKARMVGTPAIVPSVNNAMVVAYANSQSVFLDERFTEATPEVQEMTPGSDDEAEVAEPTRAPVGGTPAHWIQWLKSRACVIPHYIYEYNTSCWRENLNTREGSIGQYLYKRAAAPYPGEHQSSHQG